VNTGSEIVLIVLCIITIVGSFWVLYGTHPRDPR
jgi:heme/copper-type cytochrome/quinol oxidase subunit 4